MTAKLLLPPDQYRRFACDERGLAYRLGRLALRGVTPEQCEIRDIDQITFDFGGCARIGEEVIKVDVEGTVFAATLTQFPWAIAALQQAKPKDGFIEFSGFMGLGYSFPVEVKEKLLWKMEQLWPEVSAKCQKAEEDISIALSKAGVLNKRPPQPDKLVP